MSRKLPSLWALQVFEAAARHLSFTEAARELHLTQSAVSRQVRLLEEQLGAPLFERLTRALRLTPAGVRVQRASTQAFDRLEAGLAGLPHARRSALVLSVLPSFAARWLMPRLPAFQAAHPEIELRLVSTNELTDLGSLRRPGDADVAIRFWRRSQPGLTSERLLGDEAFPACTPALARRLREPSDLRRFVLLHDEVRGAHGGWPEWLAKARAKGVDGRKGPSFNDASLLLQAALEGQGVALARRVLVERELAAGRLVRPFPQTIPCRHHYALVMPPSRAQSPQVQALRAFLLRECAEGPAVKRRTQSENARPAPRRLPKR
jgi:LysR family transcriptional regulator, glycine cleavage system transcriptional activator